jgi:hypothetical protein
MVRTQIQLTEQQMNKLRRLAAEKRKPLAELVRQGVELYLNQQRQTGKALRVRRALQAAGKFSSGTPTGSSDHDRHLATAFR